MVGVPCPFIAIVVFYSREIESEATRLIVLKSKVSQWSNSKLMPTSERVRHSRDNQELCAGSRRSSATWRSIQIRGRRSELICATFWSQAIWRCTMVAFREGIPNSWTRMWCGVEGCKINSFLMKRSVGSRRESSCPRPVFFLIFYWFFHSHFFCIPVDCFTKNDSVYWYI